MSSKQKTGETITIFFLAALSLLGCFGLVSLIPYLSFTPWQWDIILSCLALITNGLLCSMQVVVIFRLGELRSDHINHYDVENVMRRIVVPEQVSQVRKIRYSGIISLRAILMVLQVILAILHALNSAWAHALCQVSLTLIVWSLESTNKFSVACRSLASFLPRYPTSSHQSCYRVGKHLCSLPSQRFCSPYSSALAWKTSESILCRVRFPRESHPRFPRRSAETEVGA